jgi:hypothetical protein
MPIYRGFLQNIVHPPSFTVLIDSETSSWSSDPPGHDIRSSFVGDFSREDGAIGASKRFELHPGGLAMPLGQRQSIPDAK